MEFSETLSNGGTEPFQGLHPAEGDDGWVEEKHFRVVLNLASGDWVELSIPRLATRTSITLELLRGRGPRPHSRGRRPTLSTRAARPCERRHVPCSQEAR